MMEGEVDVRIYEYDPLEGGQYIAEFGGIGLQELPSSGHVEEEVLDLEVTAHGTGYGLLRLHLRTCNPDTGTYLILFTARLQRHMCHGGDRGQSLTTESHRVKGEEVVGLCDLRGSMTLERQSGICLRHALAVVDHLDEGTSCIQHHHMDGRGTCIHGVLDQLLDDGSRSLDDLTSSNLIGHTIG